MARKVPVSAPAAEWRAVEVPQPAIVVWGETPGRTIIGTLTAKRSVETQFGACNVYEFLIDDSAGSVAVFARGTLDRLLSDVARHPGPGCVVRIRFTGWTKTRGGKAREWEVAVRVDPATPEAAPF